MKMSIQESMFFLKTLDENYDIVEQDESSD